MRTIKEIQAARQAKEIFNNTLKQMCIKLIEETNEVVSAVMSGSPIMAEILEELGDLKYVFSQLTDYFKTNDHDLLKNTIIKNEKKRVK